MFPLDSTQREVYIKHKNTDDIKFPLPWNNHSIFK